MMMYLMTTKAERERERKDEEEGDDEAGGRALKRRDGERRFPNPDPEAKRR